MSRNLLTSYEVDYGKLKGDARTQKALADIADYIGDRKFRENTKLFQSEGEHLKFMGFAFMCELIGVRGYPVRAWWDHCYPERAGEYDRPEPDSGEHARED